MNEGTRLRVKAFLREYAQISEKYSVSIHACGCCESPFLDEDNAVTDFDIQHLWADFDREKEPPATPRVELQIEDCVIPDSREVE